jgi:hypothetical protein
METTISLAPYSYPLGIGVNRLLKNSGDIPDSWRERLNILLGADAWHEEFYSFQTTKTLLTLFGTEQDHIIKASMETIGQYFIDRLRSVFAGVAEKPGVAKFHQ